MKNINDKLSLLTRIIFGLSILLVLIACDQLAGSKSNSKSKASTSQQSQLWSRLRNNFNISKKEIHDSSNTQSSNSLLSKIHKSANKKSAETPNALTSHQKVQKYVLKYGHQQTLKKLTTPAEPYLYYVIEQLEKRNMPGELALLPFIESAYQPQATSNRGAAGIWQFIPSTGRYFGLKQDRWYDGRRDIAASTNAALNYLAFLHKEFNQNWMLALAAYNSGEGTVKRAISRNKRAGKSTSFWDLNLPKETREYVPRFLALAEVIGNPEKHDVLLPAFDNQPYFKLVNLKKPLNFKQAATLAEIDVAKIKQLNPAYRQFSTHPKGPQQLLLPVINAEKFEFNQKQVKKH